MKMSQANESSPQMPGPTGMPNSQDDLDSAHGNAAGWFQHVQKANKEIQTTRKELDKLSALGDSVTPEDVIESAARQVASGRDPVQLATSLADMPQNGGEALATWVKQKDQMVQQAEAHMGMIEPHARHMMGVAALHKLIGHQVGTPGDGEPAMGAATPALAPSLGVQ
jgi:hypothetical protein